MGARNFSIPGKRSSQHLYVLHVRDIEPTPSWNAAAALAALLLRK
jgi:hypothetical protein